VDGSSGRHFVVYGCDHPTGNLHFWVLSAHPEFWTAVGGEKSYRERLVTYNRLRKSPKTRSAVGMAQSRLKFFAVLESSKMCGHKVDFGGVT
jgi:hypothetical protein